MSIYSEWRHGSMDYDEFKFAAAREARQDKYLEDKMYEENWSEDDEEDENDV